MADLLSLTDLRSQRARQYQNDEEDEARQFGDSFLTLDKLKEQHAATQRAINQQIFENSLKGRDTTVKETDADVRKKNADTAVMKANDIHDKDQAEIASKNVATTAAQQKIDDDNTKARSTAVEQTVRAARARGAKDLHDLVDMPDLQVGLQKFEGQGAYPEIEAEFKKQEDAQAASGAKIDLEHAQANKANRPPVPRAPKAAATSVSGERKSADEMITGMIDKANTGDIAWGLRGKLAESKHFPDSGKSQDRMDLDSQAAQLTGEWANLVVNTKRMPNKAEMEMIRDKLLPSLDSTMSKEDYVHRLQDVQTRLRRIQANEATVPSGNPSSGPAAGAGTTLVAPAGSSAPPRSPQETHKAYFARLVKFFGGDAHKAMQYMIQNDPSLGGAASP